MHPPLQFIGKPLKSSIHPLRSDIPIYAFTRNESTGRRVTMYRGVYPVIFDVVGCNTVVSEVDLICAVIEMLKGFGLGADDFSVRVSSRKLLSEFLDHLGVDQFERFESLAALVIVVAVIVAASSVPQDGFVEE